MAERERTMFTEARGGRPLDAAASHGRRRASDPPVPGPSPATVVVLCGLGAVVRLVLGFSTYGDSFDIPSLTIVADRIWDDPLGLYEHGRFPYPPLYVPVIWALRQFADVTGLAFHGVVHLPLIAADLAIALLVQRWLGRGGARPRVQLLALSLVVFGPVMILISGYQGQLDSLAMLPVVAAAMHWQTAEGHRARSCGLLIGLGVAIKTFPVLFLIALVPTARNRRESAGLVGWAAVPSVVLLLPYLLTDLRGTVETLGYTGVPGTAGLRFVVQPLIARAWWSGNEDVPEWSALSRSVGSLHPWLLVAALAVVAAVMRRRGTGPFDAAVVVCLVTYVCSANVFLQYYLWIVPFLVLTLRFRLAAVHQLVVVVAGAILFNRPHDERWLVDLYATSVVVLWIGFAAGLLWWSRVPPRRFGDGSRAEPAPLS